MPQTAPHNLSESTPSLSSRTLVVDKLPSVRRIVTSRETDETTVELADLKIDRGEIEAVWNRGFDVYPPRFQCYLSNPTGMGSVWVSRPKSAPIYGAIGLHSRRMHFGGQVFPAGQIGNLAVDSEFRTAGPALRLQRALLASLPGSDRAFIFGATSKAIQILRRVGGQPVGTAQRWTKVLRSESQLKKQVRPAILAKAIAPVLDLGLRLLSRETFSLRSAGMVVGIDRTFDARFDRLWNRSAAEFPIATERTSHYLMWRFQQRTATPYQVFWLGSTPGDLAGYVVFQVCQVCQNAVVEIADVLYDSPLTLDRLLAEFIRRMRSPEFRATSISMSYFGLSLLGERLQSFGFLQRPESMQVLVFPNSAVLGDSAKQLSDANRWFLTRADLDLDL